MKIYKVSCEIYDKSWFVRTSDEGKANELVRLHTESLGWHLDLNLDEDEEPEFEAEEILENEDEIVEWEDL